MKLLRLLLVGAGALALVVLAAIAVAFSSGFQTWAVRRALAGSPHLRASVGRVDASWRSVKVENLRIAPAGGPAVAVPLMELELPLRAALGRRLLVQRLVARGWTVDLTTSGPATPGGTGQASVLLAGPGLLRALELPVDLAIEAVELEGEMILPAAPGMPPVRAKVSLGGGGLGAGREAAFQVAASSAIPGGGPVNALEARGTVTLSMATPRTFSSVGAQLDLDARGPSLPQGARVSLTAGAAVANSGESYTLSVHSQGRSLASGTATHPGSAGAAPDRLAGTWNLNLRDSDLTPFALGHPLPGFSARGAGRFEADSRFVTLSASGRLEGSVERLEVVRRELAGVGPLALAADFDVARGAESWRIGSLSAELAAPGPVLAVRSVQPFEFNPKTGALKADATRELLTIDLRGLPVSWIQPFVPGAIVTGNQVRGAVTVGARDGGFVARSTTPLMVDGVSVRVGGRSLVASIDATLQVAGTYAPQGWQAELGAFSLRSGGVAILSGEAKAGRLVGATQPLKLQGRWTAALPALQAQPLAAGIARLASGTSSGEFSGSLGSRQELEIKLGLRDLVLESGQVQLPAIDAEGRLDREADGRISVTLPMTFEAGGRRSDLAFAGSLARAPGAWVIDGRAESRMLALEDVQLLGGLAGSRPAGAAGPRDPVPFWSGLTGRVALNARRLVYQQKFEMTDVTGAVRIEQGSMRIDNLKAALNGDGRLSALGGLAFDDREADPYGLQFEMGLVDFDSAPLFRAMGPAQPATIETRFNLNSRLAGRGGSLPALLERVTGEFQLSSNAGTSRLLRADLADRIQKAASTLSTITSFIGAATGQDRLYDYANRGTIVTDIARRFEAVPFDQLNLVVSRRPNLDFVISEFSLISPELRLSGSGEIRHAAGRPVLEQPMQLRLELRSRGALADQMRRVNLVDGQADTLGYFGFVAPIIVLGSPGKPDATEFTNALLRAAGAALIEGARGKP